MIGVILVNLGTPQSPSPLHVRQYLKQFLNDPYVIDIPAVFRWLLVEGLILRGRAVRSAEAYQKIWTERGSPLMFHTVDLAQRVGEALGAEFRVLPAMRYGQPSIEQAVHELQVQGVRKWLFVPLYPQYSYAATVTAEVEIQRVMKRLPGAPVWTVLDDFPLEEGYLASFTEVIQETARSFSPDHYLFSYHGIPERHLERGDSELAGHCLKAENCCATWGPHNRRCYRAQCFAGAHALAQRANLAPSQYTVAFQSRLGRTPWIQPFTDHVLDDLARRGVKRLAVASPSFVADCLETLEEIGLRAREQFIAAGGEDLRLVPSLNSRPSWVQAVQRRVRSHLAP